MLLLLHQAKLKTEEEEIQSHVFPSNSQKVMTHPEQLNKSFFDVKGYMTIYSLQHVCFYSAAWIYRQTSQYTPDIREFQNKHKCDKRRLASLQETQSLHAKNESYLNFFSDSRSLKILQVKCSS